MMSVLRAVATCVLAAMAVSLGTLGLRTLDTARKHQLTLKGGSQILSAARTCLATGNEQQVEIEIYSPITLLENRILIGETLYGELEGRFLSRVELAPGKHRLRVRLENGGLWVEG